MSYPSKLSRTGALRTATGATGAGLYPDPSATRAWLRLIFIHETHRALNRVITELYRSEAALDIQLRQHLEELERQGEAASKWLIQQGALVFREELKLERVAFVDIPGSSTLWFISSDQDGWTPLW